MASRDDYSSASSFTLRVTGPAAPWLVARTVREVAIVHGRWLRMTVTRVLPRLHVGLLGLRPIASSPNREGGSHSTRSMASHDGCSSASSFTRRVTGPAARWLVARTVREGAIVHGRWLRITLTRVLPRLHVGLLGLWPIASSPNREGGSDITRPMASRDGYSSASSFTRRVTGPCGPWLVARTVREGAIVHGRWLRMTVARVLPRLHVGLLGLRPGG
jgi:hypothetical protein